MRNQFYTSIETLPLLWWFITQCKVTSKEQIWCYQHTRMFKKITQKLNDKVTTTTNCTSSGLLNNGSNIISKFIEVPGSWFMRFMRPEDHLARTELDVLFYQPRLYWKHTVVKNKYTTTAPWCLPLRKSWNRYFVLCLFTSKRFVSAQMRPDRVAGGHVPRYRRSSTMDSVIVSRWIRPPYHGFTSPLMMIDSWWVQPVSFI